MIQCGQGGLRYGQYGVFAERSIDSRHHGRANIEIREEVGAENFFLFGLTAAEVEQKKAGGYQPLTHYDDNEKLHATIDLISSGHFSRGDRDLSRPLVDSLLYNDEYLLFADYQSYLDTQEAVEHAWRDTDLWSRMSILNVARMGRFSSERAVME